MTRPLAPAGVPAPAALRTLASPVSQALVAAALCLTFAALAVRMGSAIWFAAPTAALLVGIVLGLQADLRPVYVRSPGVVIASVVMVLLSLLWAMALGWMEIELPYAVVPLAGLVAFGADWWWIERLRPAVVASGAFVVVLVADGSSALPLVLGWFALGAAALWSLRGDALRAVPTPVPVDRSAPPAHEPGAGRTAAAVVGSWLAAAGLVALAGLIPLAFDSPETEGRGGQETGDPGFGSGSGQQGAEGGAGDIGPGGVVDGGMSDAVEERDVNGDGIADPDIDGDGIPDVDMDGDGIPDIDRNGDGVPDLSSVPGDDGPEAAETPPSDGGADSPAGGGAGDSDTGDSVLRAVGMVVVALLVIALVAVALRALAWERVRRRALATRPWAIRLAERLEDEGARRGRPRRRDEPVSHYAAALAGDVLAHDRLVDVGDALSAALFAPGTPSDATGEWAVGVVDEAVEANPAPTWWRGVTDRLTRRPRD